MRPIFASAALLLLLSEPAAAQVQREVVDCSVVPRQDRAVCEARNIAVTKCRLEASDERFSACVEAALQTPPPLLTPGFSRAGSGKPPGK